MQKFAAVFLVMLIAAMIAGCGSGGLSNVSTVQSATKEIISPDDVKGKTFFISSINDFTEYTFNADAGKTASWIRKPKTTAATPVVINGTWDVSTDGILILTSTIENKQFTRIQTENKGTAEEYWLVFDQSNTVSRFFTTLKAAQDYSPAKMGGAVLGGTISAKSSNYSVATFAGSVDSAGFLDDTGTAAKFRQPTSITTNGKDFYVADYLNNVIRQITGAGLVSTIAGTAGLAGSANGIGTAAFFNHPSDITTDGTNLYVVDSLNNAIRIINLSSFQVSTIGSTSSLAGSIDTTVPAGQSKADPTLARFNAPTGITTDGTNLYVADSGNHTIRKIVISSGAVTTFAGTVGSSGSDIGTGTSAKFFLPTRITTDGSNLYVTDFRNRTIRKIVIATREVTTIAGAVGIPGTVDSSDGTGNTARFNQPNGITTDGTNLYVTDSFENTVRKIVISNGVVSTISGIAGSPGNVDSTGGPPSFNTPIGITTDGVSLYIADSFNHTIRRID